MRGGISGVYASLIFLVSATRLGEAFLFSGSRFTSAWHQPQQHDLPASPHTKAAAVTNIFSRVVPRTTTSSQHVVPAGASTEQQLPSFPGVDGVEVEVEEGAAQPPPPKTDSTRRGTALDGTPLAFRLPTTEDLHKLQMGSLVAQRGLAVALVALDGTGQETKAPGEAVVDAPLAGAVVEAMEGVGGSSVATRVCLLRHRREDGVSEAVEHALLDETINQFLNDGARISQVSLARRCGSCLTPDRTLSVDVRGKYGCSASIGHAFDELELQTPPRCDKNNDQHILRRSFGLCHFQQQHMPTHDFVHTSVIRTDSLTLCVSNHNAINHLHIHIDSLPSATSLRICSFQLRVEADDSPESVAFYARHGFIRSTGCSPLSEAEAGAKAEGRVLLAGDRGAALSAIKAMMVSPVEGEGECPNAVGAVVMNLMARLLHDAGNLEGAVDAYLKALEVREHTMARSGMV